LGAVTEENIMIQMKTFLDKSSTGNPNAMAHVGGKKKAWLSQDKEQAARRNSGASSERANLYLDKGMTLTEHGLKGLEKKPLSKS
jgi:hypothetical protein|tara:strand:+ start:484 stop:738 length:255 start_codon:yes stop_codon:yes gene_type:complete